MSGTEAVAKLKIVALKKFTLTLMILTFAVATLAAGQSNAPTDSDTPPAANQPPQVVRVSNGVMLGMVQHKTMPVYPEEAMKKGIQGDVLFKIKVDEKGKITDNEPVKGDPVLISASQDALRTFSFRPYLLNGTPVRVESELGFHFTVEKTADRVNGHVECIATIPDQP
jgi:TonB family protein